jgi:hypothetical protein
MQEPALRQPRSPNGRDQGQVQHRRDRPNRNNRHSGVRNVYRDKKRWRAQFSRNGIQVHLGAFDSVAEAEAAVRKARARIAAA